MLKAKILMSCISLWSQGGGAASGHYRHTAAKAWEISTHVSGRRVLALVVVQVAPIWLAGLRR
jgi:hypothetical protein